MAAFPRQMARAQPVIIPTALQDQARQERFAAQSSELRLCFLISFESFYLDFNGGKVSTVRLNKSVITSFLEPVLSLFFLLSGD